jgi:hypothetical protein
LKSKFCKNTTFTISPGNKYSSQLPAENVSPLSELCLSVMSNWLKAENSALNNSCYRVPQYPLIMGEVRHLSARIDSMRHALSCSLSREGIQHPLIMAGDIYSGYKYLSTCQLLCDLMVGNVRFGYAFPKSVQIVEL